MTISNGNNKKVEQWTMRFIKKIRAYPFHKMEEKLQIMPPKAGYYPVDDVPCYVQKIMDMRKKKPRKRRMDLLPGVVVVVMSGPYANRRVIYLRQLDDYKAACIGPLSINGIPLFTIDERFLFKTTVVLQIGRHEGANNVEERHILDFTGYDSYKPSDLERYIECAILKEVAKMKFMKTYLMTPFTVPRDGHPLQYEY